MDRVCFALFGGSTLKRIKSEASGISCSQEIVKMKDSKGGHFKSEISTLQSLSLTHAVGVANMHETDVHEDHVVP